MKIKLKISPVSSGVHGFSLIEMMIALSIGSMLALTISQATQFAAQAMKTTSVQMDQSTFKGIIRSALLSPKICPTILMTLPDPTAANGTTTATGLLLSQTTDIAANKTIFDTDTTAHARITDDLTISAISYQKNQDAYPASPVFQSGAAWFRPIIGTLSITVNNLAVQNKRAFGTKQSVYTFPLTLNMWGAAATGPWTVKNCQVEPVPAGSTNLGWQTVDLGDTTYCQQRAINSDTPVTCPNGMYVAKQVQTVTPNSHPTYANYNVCNVRGCGCKGCVCVAGSWCTYGCDSSGNPTISGHNLMGTCCDPSPYLGCSVSGWVPDPPTVTLTITCCRVQKY